MPRSTWPYQNYYLELKKSGIPNPMMELEYILKYINKTNKNLDEIIKRRLKREPLAKIIGQKEFWDYTFKTNHHTLDPRPESETLIEACLDLKITPLSILDLGTGTGCLLLTLLKLYKKSQGIGVDISKDALKVASQNAKNLGLENRSTFIESNWLDKVQGSFDLIISNPPYIKKDDTINKEATYDPKLALFSGKDGLDSYKEIFKHIGQYMQNSTYLILEIGYQQKDLVVMLAKKFYLKFVKAYKDLSQIERVLIFNKES